MAILIDSRFRGPDDSGNGGYSCGVIAREHGGAGRGDAAAAAAARRVAAARRRRPRLGRPRARRRGARRMRVGARAAAARSRGTTPSPRRRPISTRRSRSASSAGMRARDGLHIHAGPVAGRDVVAAPWQVARDTVGPEFVWAALDCPGAYATGVPRSRRRRARPADRPCRARAAGRRALRRRRLAARQRRAQARRRHRALHRRQASCSGWRAPSGSSRAADRTSPSTTSQTRVAVDRELDALAEVDRLAVLERRACSRPPSRPATRSSSGAQYAALFTWPSRSMSVTRSGHRATARPCGAGSVEARRGAPARCRLAVDLEERRRRGAAAAGRGRGGSRCSRPRCARRVAAQRVAA